MTRHTCRGFSLPELAISLVIIGILALVVLNSTSMVGTADAIKLLSITRDLKEATSAFKERYGYYPGDLPNANKFLPELGSDCTTTVALTGTGRGNGLIDTSIEMDCVADHLRRAGSFSSDQDIFEVEMAGEIITIELIATNSTVEFSDVAALNLTKHVIRFSNIPRQLAISLDTKLDDGTLDSGKIQASSTTADPIPAFVIPLQ